MTHAVKKRVTRKRGDPTLGRRKAPTPGVRTQSDRFSRGGLGGGRTQHAVGPGGRPLPQPDLNPRRKPVQGKAGPGDDLFPKKLPGRRPIPVSQPVVKTPTKGRLRVGQPVGKAPQAPRSRAKSLAGGTQGPTRPIRGKPPTSPGPNLKKKVPPKGKQAPTPGTTPTGRRGGGFVIRKDEPTGKTTNRRRRRRT